MSKLIKQKILRGLGGKSVYKVSCEFYISAKDEEEAQEIVADDMAYSNFLEEHIMIEESELPEGEGIFNEE